MSLKVEDPYEWLEDISNPKVIEWAFKEDNHTRNFLNDYSQILRSRVEKYYSIPYISSIKVASTGYYVLVRELESFKIKLLTRDGEHIDIVDSKALGDDTIIQYFYINPNGDKLAFSYSHGGADVGKLRIIDTNTLEVIDEIEGVISDIVWLNSNKYYYVRLYRDEKTPDGVEPPTERVFLRENGRDEMVFGVGVPTSHHISLKVSNDYTTALLSVSYGWTRSKVYGGPLTKPESWQYIYGGDFIVCPVDSINGKYIVLSYDKSLGRILSISDGIVKVIVDEKEYPLQDALLASNYIIAHYLVNASSKLTLYDLTGSLVKTISFDVVGSVSSLHHYDGEVVFKYESFTIPYRLYSLKNGNLKVIRGEDISDNYIVDEGWVKSRDGTDIHFFIVRKSNTSLKHAVVYGLSLIHI